MDNEVLFHVENISKTFVSTHALTDVNFTLKRGEIHGLMGENGSGKSTLASIIAGVRHLDKGNMTYKGVPYAPHDVLSAMNQGVCLIVQEQGTFTETTAAENIYSGDEKQFCKFGVLNTKMMMNNARVLLKSLNISDIEPNTVCSKLSFENRKLLEVARATRYNPDLLIIDETTTALSRTGRHILYDLMEKIKAEGKSVIFISHDLEEVIDRCDTISILRDGRFIKQLNKAEFDASTIKKLMVGREISGEFYRNDYESTSTDEIALQINDISYSLLKNVSFSLKKGEILGIGGLTDCGMHDLGKILFGLIKPDSGEVTTGECIRIVNPTSAMKLGLGYVSKDRDKESIMTAASIQDNICLPALGKISRLGLTSMKKEKKYSEKLADLLLIKRRNINQYCMYLSGGNKQKVVIAKWLGFDAEILILDCPTRGIDVVVKADIYRLMEKLKAQGKSIIMISEELQELIGMSDRIILLKNGRITGNINRTADLHEGLLIECMI